MAEQHSLTDHQWHVSENLSTASVAAAEFLRQQIEQCLQDKASCHIALPGGNTPVQCLSLLLEKDLPWEKLHWYLGDERCYPAGHKERNDTMIRQHFWSKLTQTHTYPVHAEQGAEVAAKAYAELLDQLGPLDIVFLGMGEDGHTASLFPNNPALQDTASVVAVHNAPKPPPDRVSLGLSSLQQARCRMVLSCGEAKAEVLQRVKHGDALPVNRLGGIHWFVDKAAMSSP